MGSDRELSGPFHVGLEHALTHHGPPVHEDPVEVGCVHSPNDCADGVVDRVDVRPVGAEHDQVRLLPGLQRPGDITESGCASAVAGPVADHIPGGQQVGEPGLAGELEVEIGRVLQRDDGPHLGEHVTGSHELVVDAKPGADAAIDEALHRRGSEAPGHLAGGRQRHGASRRGYRFEIGVG